MNVVAACPHKLPLILVRIPDHDEQLHLEFERLRMDHL